MPVPTPEELYFQLGSLVAEMPDLTHDPITPEVNRWLGRAAILVELAEPGSVIALNLASQNLHGILREPNAQIITAIVHRALAWAEFLAPVSSQGAFIAAGHTFDAFVAVGKALGEAKTDVLMVDPYADEKALTDYAILAPEKVTIRLLASNNCKSSLKPAADHWGRQFGETRPLAVRLVPPKTLHDRLILVDHKTAWVLGQSFKDLAARAHTSLVRMPSDAAALKLDAYEELWASAERL
jgi:hypothetical protein